MSEPSGDFGALMEVRLLRWGESSTAGRTITLELHPDEGDAHPFKTFKSGAKNGQRFWMVLRPIADDEQPASQHEVGERPLSVTRPVQQGVIHTDMGFPISPDSVEESVLDGGATMLGQPGCGWICVHAYDICKRIKSGEHCDHCIPDAPGMPLTSAGLTPKARYAAMTAGEQARTRAGKLPREDERFRVWAADQKAGGGARPMHALSEGDAAQFIRDRCCGGKSRKLIATDPEAMDKFIALETAFKIAVGEIAEPR